MDILKGYEESSDSEVEGSISACGLSCFDDGEGHYLLDVGIGDSKQSLPRGSDSLRGAMGRMFPIEMGVHMAEKQAAQ